ncbi:PAS domain-containing protein [Myxococcota bacterium]|nr:PAS domain-containing protein [Myxococcota bacterium]MBU1382050.1 PAS domain-containing protein [Myxococcota bacterium]MBU1495552.1 PAS domain-containing protein [Myxococcota bacterium]
MNQFEAFEIINDIIIDSWFSTDAQGQITGYNRMFYSLFPRAIARKLKGIKLQDTMDISVDIVSEAITQKRQVRFDEINAVIPEVGEFRFIMSAIPVTDEGGQITGTVVIMRNVTDEAMVQVKYQEMLDREARERELLRDELNRRTESLIEISKKYFELRASIKKRLKGQLSPFILKINQN